PVRHERAAGGCLRQQRHGEDDGPRRRRRSAGADGCRAALRRLVAAAPRFLELRARRVARRLADRATRRRGCLQGAVGAGDDRAAQRRRRGRSAVVRRCTGQLDADDRRLAHRRRGRNARVGRSMGRRARDAGKLADHPTARTGGCAARAPARPRGVRGWMKLARLLSALVKSNDRRFVSLLCDQADLAVRSLQLLRELERDGRAPEQGADAVKQVEREGDEIRRILIDELARTYSTPFDREDLFVLSRAIDDIIDAADEAARELATFRIAPPEGLGQMTDVLVEGARHIRLAVAELVDHPTVAADHAVRAKRSENRIDDIYHASVDELFDSTRETSALLKVREIYRHLKNSADRIDEVADDISIIVIKRS